MDGIAVKEAKFRSGNLPDLPKMQSRKACFLCREASIIILGQCGTISKSAFFSVPQQHWSTADRKTIRYAMYNLHGMDVIPAPTEQPLYQQCELGMVMEGWYELVQNVTRQKRPMIAYKGGIVERDLLDALDIPSVNLEDWGCPKAGCLVSLFPEVKCHHH